MGRVAGAAAWTRKPRYPSPANSSSFSWSILSPISKAGSSHPTEEAHFSRLYLQSRSFGHYPNLVAIDEGRNKDQPVKKPRDPGTKEFFFDHHRNFSPRDKGPSPSLLPHRKACRWGWGGGHVFPLPIYNILGWGQQHTIPTVHSVGSALLPYPQMLDENLFATARRLFSMALKNSSHDRVFASANNTNNSQDPVPPQGGGRLPSRSPG